MDPTRNYEEIVPRRDCSAAGYLKAPVFYVRLDDRGDLGVYVAADHEGDAYEEAVSYAQEEWGPDCIREEGQKRDEAPEGGWVVNEDDIYVHLLSEGVADEVRDAFFRDDHGGLSQEDVEWLSEQRDAKKDADTEAEPDDGPDVVMTSLGYVDLWLDGEVVLGGVTITTLKPTVRA